MTQSLTCTRCHTYLISIRGLSSSCPSQVELRAVSLSLQGFQVGSFPFSRRWATQNAPALRGTDLFSLETRRNCNYFLSLYPQGIRNYPRKITEICKRGILVRLHHSREEYSRSRRWREPTKTSVPTWSNYLLAVLKLRRDLYLI